jgi:hypothetical protein
MSGGRVQRHVRRCLIAADGPVPFSELMAWAFEGRQRPWRLSVYRALWRYGVNVRRGWWKLRQTDSDCC